MSAAATGGTIVINSAPTRHSSVALDYEMGLVRVAASSAAFGNSTSGFRVRPNDVAMIAPSTPTKIVRSCPSTPTGLRTPPGSITGIVTKPNNKRSKVAIEESSVSVDGKPLSEHDYSGGGSGILAASQARLRDLLVAQLDLIKKQSDAIIAKDRQLRELRQENRSLQQRLFNLGQNSNGNTHADLKKGNGILISTHTSISSNNKSHLSTTIVTKDKAVETTSELLENYSKYPKTKDSSCSNRVAITSAQSDQPDKHTHAENLHLSSTLETDKPYYTFQGEEFLKAEANEIKEILSQSEVPGWRILAVPPCYSMEGTENIEDETVLKRHNKPELDEKRRKRWDMQRLRQQRQVERLRARYDGTEPVALNVNHNNPKNVIKKAQTPTTKSPANGLSHMAEKPGEGTITSMPSSALNQKLGALSSNNYVGGGAGLKENDWLTTLQPVPELATHVQVSEKLPVNAFGFCVPIIATQGFSLPWMNESTKDKGGVRSKKCCSSKNNKNGKLTVVTTCSPTQKCIKKYQGNKAANKPITHSVNGHINGITGHQYQQSAHHTVI